MATTAARPLPAPTTTATTTATTTTPPLASFIAVN